MLLFTKSLFNVNLHLKCFHFTFSTQVKRQIVDISSLYKLIIAPSMVFREFKASHKSWYPLCDLPPPCDDFKTSSPPQLFFPPSPINITMTRQPTQFPHTPSPPRKMFSPGYSFVSQDKLTLHFSIDAPTSTQ